MSSSARLCADDTKPSEPIVQSSNENVASFSESKLISKPESQLSSPYKHFGTMVARRLVMPLCCVRWRSHPRSWGGRIRLLTIGQVCTPSYIVMCVGVVEGATVFFFVFLWKGRAVVIRKSQILRSFFVRNSFQRTNGGPPRPIYGRCDVIVSPDIPFSDENQKGLNTWFYIYIYISVCYIYFFLDTHFACNINDKSNDIITMRSSSDCVANRK